MKQVVLSHKRVPLTMIQVGWSRYHCPRNKKPLALYAHPRYSQIVLDVFIEKERGAEKYPDRFGIAIAIAAECGEFMNAIRRQSPKQIRKEAIQLMATVVRFLNDGDPDIDAERKRRGLKPFPLITTNH